MIAIVNVTPERNPFVTAKYNVMIKANVICEFEHKRTDGLAECLRAAADAVERTRTEETLAIVEAFSKGKE